MFGFFKKRPPADPPTDKQRRYAAKLGIEVCSSMTKSELSEAIANAERKRPELTAQRERVKGKAREKKFGKEVLDEEAKWKQLAEEVCYILAVYTRGKQTIVDVLQVNDVFINDRGKLVLGIETPKLVKDRHIGDYLDWDRHLDLPISSLLYYEPLHLDFPSDGNDAYKKMVEKGLTIARTL